MNGEAIMALLATNLATAMPARIVTRDAKDFAQRQPADRHTGVVTLVSGRITDLKRPDAFRDHAGKLAIALLFEFELPESATGLQVEQAEWAFWAELDAFNKAPGAGLCPLEVLTVILSAQRDKPQGWIAAQLEYSELD